MAPPDNHGDTAHCEHISRMLARISDKWTMLVVRVLGRGPCRFNALRREVGEISQKVLASTLRELEENGFVSRTVNAYTLRVAQMTKVIRWFVLVCLIFFGSAGIALWWYSGDVGAAFCRDVRIALKCTGDASECLLHMHRSLSSDLSRLKNSRADLWSNSMRLNEVDKIYEVAKGSLTQRLKTNSQPDEKDIQEIFDDCMVVTHEY